MTGAMRSVRQLAMEGREFGIRANSISPGLTETNQTKDQFKDPEWADERGPVPCSYVTGVDVVVDGGTVSPKAT